MWREPPEARRKPAPMAPKGELAVVDHVQRLLQQHLTADQFERLTALSRGWQEMPFAYDPELNAFHVRDEWVHGAFSEPDDVPEETLDLLLLAAEILTEHRDELDCRSLLETAADEEEKEEHVTVHFPVAEILAAAHLEELLEHTDYRVESRDTPDGYVVTVYYRYRTDHEFASRRNHIQWLIDLARHLGSGRRYKGWRLT